MKDGQSSHISCPNLSNTIPVGIRLLKRRVRQEWWVSRSPGFGNLDVEDEWVHLPLHSCRGVPQVSEVKSQRVIGKRYRQFFYFSLDSILGQVGFTVEGLIVYWGVPGFSLFRPRNTSDVTVRVPWSRKTSLSRRKNRDHRCLFGNRGIDE